jgi:hypothetical protein
MEITYRLRASEISPDLLKSIKEFFRGRNVIITVTTDQDETDYLTSNVANFEHLKNSMAEEPAIKFTAQEFEALVAKMQKGKA